MNLNFIDIQGQRFGRWTVLAFDQTVNGNARWLCRCDCGEEVVVEGQSLRKGVSRSCGCLVREENASRNAFNRLGERHGRLLVIQRLPHKTNAKLKWLCLCDCGKVTRVSADNLRIDRTGSCGCLRVKHGKSGSPELNIWAGMRRRCEKPNTRGFKYYGGRGIRVCDRWQEFENFLTDMGSRPSPKHTIDRIDPDGNYDPSNCRWATPTEQSRNRRTVPVYTVFGRTQSGPDWAEEFGISNSLFKSRLEAGWGIERALTTPKRI